ncbi:inositol monophosphatase [Litoribacter ruber]|uniref:inositol monophosphatase family protein n=1 Tax=Litoribacter ruber TaxID=702568 RepID=UPI001BD9AC05|nr:inositol monophosphatase family protein [Litoribacter ruber]MBT0812040.1 inositol monophosphatase [Litoribacter ruber]
MLDFNVILERTKETAKKAGEFIRQESESFNVDKVEHKGFNDLVSYVDKQAEKIIVDNLSQILPEAGFITEEGTAESNGEAYSWIIDPLDGTTNFVHGIPVYAVSIALIHKNELQIGVVYEINRDECFYAQKGGGAFCNGKPIKVSKAPTLEDSLVATGFPYYDFGLMERYLALLANMMKKTHGVRRLGSAAMDLCYVACGRVEGYFEYNLNSYDVAGGAIIVSEAGGKVTDFDGGSNHVFGRNIIASNGNIHEEMLEEIKIFKKS